jgi:DNA repair protein SbcC/Rad50
MVTRRLFRSALHEHTDPTQRVIGVAELAPDSDELAALLATDPAPEVRLSAANRCTNLDALAKAWIDETDPAVRFSITSALGTVLAESPDAARAMVFLDSHTCTDAIRAEVARRTTDAVRRRLAIAAIHDESALIELALAADYAETRMAAAEHVHTPEGLRQLADAAERTDRGVARHARKRIKANAHRAGRVAEADAILADLEALADKPGPILTAVIELDRRWEALHLSDDPVRRARCNIARQMLQARFDREHEAQRARMRFDRDMNEWLAEADSPATADELSARLTQLMGLREQGEKFADASALAKLEEADQRVERWTEELHAIASAEALVVEAELLAAGTGIDSAKLPERWQALDLSIRTPGLTRRFEAALIVVEQRRLAQIRASEQEASAARHHVHSLLGTAEQALAAGRLQAARAAADDIRARRADASSLAKPTIQRLNRLTQELIDLERWESFGQEQARVRLCERAEAAPRLALDPPRLAVEVRTLRNEWKALDQQHAGVPKALWERFDRACEKAYAPASRHFAEQAALRKQARKQREEFIAAAVVHAPKLLHEPRDWRAIERWLRETDHRWRDGELGNIEPKVRKSLDARLKAALAPLRDALSEARDQATARRVALIEEVTALVPRATERDAPAQVKAIQAKWQVQAKDMALAVSAERALWAQFRTACNAVFQARDAKRKQEYDLKQEDHRALEDICVQLEQLASATDKEDKHLRRALRDLEGRWKQRTRASDPTLRGIESRFRKAKSAVEAALSARARAREAAVWQTLAAKERLCEDVEGLLGSRDRIADVAAWSNARWTALSALPAAWEKAMLARRDSALRALADDTAAAAYLTRIERGAELRREMLLEAEILLGLECPPDLQAQRLALQVKHLRERFQSVATIGPNTAGELLLAWCAQPGVVDARDRQRCERVFSAMERAR